MPNMIEEADDVCLDRQPERQHLRATGRTSAHSIGLSSTKMKLSNPRFSSWASDLMLSDLGCQLIRQETR